MDQNFQLLYAVTITLTAFFLVGSFVLTAMNSALRRLYRTEPKKEMIVNKRAFFYRPFHLYFFPKHEFEGLFFATLCAQNICRFCYVACFIALFLSFPNEPQLSWGLISLFILIFLVLTFLVADFFPRTFGTKYPDKAISLLGPIASFFLFLAFPMTFIFLKLFKKLSYSVYFDHLNEFSAEAQKEIMEIIQEAGTVKSLDTHDKKMIESVVTFKDRIAREVMVPRVDVFSLSAETSIREAAEVIQAEGYSRTPVYKNNIDNIIGILMYKDILNKYMEYKDKGNDPKILEAPISTIVKNVLYTPETKKVSNLLQEFRKKQMHIAIVVDEYGGTEGIVTIEDILEEIVGEIADEYDEKEALFYALPEGGWVVDARMSILDTEELLGIDIPQEGEFDTIGGYVFHRTGSIPPRGFVIHHDNFDLEILSSNERVVEKVKIRPVTHSH